MEPLPVTLLPSVWLHLSWDQALARCQQENAELAVIKDAGVENFIGSLLHTQLSVLSFFAFVGGFQPNPAVDQWAWVDGSTWSYENWISGEPNDLLNDGNEACLT